MSKKKGKAAPARASKKTAARRPVSGARTAPRAAIAESGRTVTATIFIYRTGSGNRIRTSPQRLYANPGDRVEWSVVNLVDGSDVPVTISWPDKSPFAGGSIQFKNVDRQSLTVSEGRFKYNVSALDAREDPEIEIPDV